MPESARPVDAAMAEQRPAKRRVRSIWIQEVRLQKLLTPGTMPFYLTLSGAEALDIELLLANGVIRKTVDDIAIADEDNQRVIAVEKDSNAALEILRKYPGLKVVEGDIFDELRGASPIRYPEGRRRRLFQATVVNLDLTRSLVYDESSSNYPQLESVIKLANLHTLPNIDWTLLFTVQGEIYWPDQAQLNAQSFLAETASAHDELAVCLAKVIGEEFYEKLLSGEAIDLRAADVDLQQKVVMLFVPAFLISKLTPLGWRVEVALSAFYGGEPGVAPMVTWVMRMRRDIRAAGSPLKVTKEGIVWLSKSCAFVDDEGNLIKFE